MGLAVPSPFGYLFTVAQFLILILLLIFKRQEITIMTKSKIKRREVAKQSLNSMAGGSG